MFIDFNPLYRCTRTRIARSLLNVGDYFSLAPIRSNSVVKHFVRKVVYVDLVGRRIIDHFGHDHPFSGDPVYICVPRSSN